MRNSEFDGIVVVPTDTPPENVPVAARRTSVEDVNFNDKLPVALLARLANMSCPSAAKFRMQSPVTVFRSPLVSSTQFVPVSAESVIFVNVGLSLKP